MHAAARLPRPEGGRWASRLLWLPALLWVAWMERRVVARGEPLDARWLEAARALGVHRPERVRVHRVGQLPGRLPAGLRRALVRTGLLPPGLSGMALRYGILLREDCRDDATLLLHELAHTAQYERLGGIGPFLRCYLRECLGAGYGASQLEREATDAALGQRARLPGLESAASRPPALARAVRDSRGDC